LRRSAASRARARRELIATGEKVRKRSAETHDLPTPKEERIACLAPDGLSNRETGAQLIISGLTGEWHLRKVFAKLGISSRMQLPTALSGKAGPSRASSVDPGTDQGVTRARGTARSATLMRIDGQGDRR
jgi:DNA-binding CsgD family transcriptional regulator